MKLNVLGRYYSWVRALHEFMVECHKFKLEAPELYVRIGGSALLRDTNPEQFRWLAIQYSAFSSAIPPNETTLRDLTPGIMHLEEHHGIAASTR